jgi:hypothetical protein
MTVAIAPGTVGFYAPDPGSKKSPMICLGRGEPPTSMAVYEVATECTFTIDDEEWMSRAQLQQRQKEVAASPRYAEGSEMADMRAPMLQSYANVLAHADLIDADLIARVIAKHAAIAPSAGESGDVPDGSYTVSVTIPFAGEQRELVAQLQALYDEGSVAGFFQTQPASHGFGITFIRDISDDAPILDENYPNHDRANAAMLQLSAELREASDSTGVGLVIAEALDRLPRPPKHAPRPEIGQFQTWLWDDSTESGFIIRNECSDGDDAYKAEQWRDGDIVDNHYGTYDAVVKWTENERAGQEAWLAARAGNPAFDGMLPWVAYTLLTADQCSRTEIFQAHGDQLVCYPGDWSPHEPNDPTDFVNLELHANGVVAASDEIAGDAHRDLESRGLLESFVSAYIEHGEVSAAAQAVDLPAVERDAATPASPPAPGL